MFRTMVADALDGLSPRQRWGGNSCREIVVEPHPSESEGLEISSGAPLAQVERIAARAAELGEGLTIHRALPTRQRRMVGAWCFLDHVGPVAFASGNGMHVGAHPHTSLQTFTWMLEGEILHRDSLGSEQVIRPGQVNLMTAGRGIAHTEDSLPSASRVHAAQLWIALPSRVADCAPAFDHYPELPVWTRAGCTLTLLAGTYEGRTAPARLYSPLVGLDIGSPQPSVLRLPLDPAFEYAILPLEGSVAIAGETFGPNEFAYLGMHRQEVALECAAGSRVLLLGGEPFGETLLMWWNFVGFSRQAITEAQREWEAQGPRFGAVKGGEGRRIPAPALPWVGG